MNIRENVALKAYNTFGIAAQARHFVAVTELDQLQRILELEAYPKKSILGGGSNILLTQDVEALVIHIDLKGIRVVEEDKNEVVVEVMAGENWHELVLWSLEKGYGGLENLSLIPGNIGAAPIQNIGAYGVELKDVFVRCTAVQRDTGKPVIFDREACAFGYRDSIFKQSAKDAYIITAVHLRLTKHNHKRNIAYGAIEAELKKNEIIHPTPRDIANAVIALRQRKLPDPKTLGNSGSFFKNPILSKMHFEAFIHAHPQAPHYKVDEEHVKVPAGWLIEQCGFKGKRFGAVGVYEKQALVLVNHGAANGGEVLKVVHRIQHEVHQKFGIALQPEVHIM